jgi:hypothetical protein
LKNETPFSKIWRLQSTGWFHKSHKLNRKVGSGHAFYLEIKVAFVVELTARALSETETGTWYLDNRLAIPKIWGLSRKHFGAVVCFEGCLSVSGKNR